MKNGKNITRISRLRNNLTGVRNRIKDAVRKLQIPTDKGFVYIWIDKIIYCKADTSYTTFHLEGGSTVVASKNIGVFESILAASDFFRAHKSYLINLQHVNEYRKEDCGCVTMDNDTKIVISRRNKTRFQNLFRDR